MDKIAVLLLRSRHTLISAVITRISLYYIQLIHPPAGIFAYKLTENIKHPHTLKRHNQRY